MVYIFCRNAQSESHSDSHDVCTVSLLYQLPNCNLFTQHVLFILWRDTTSELWTPVQFPLHRYTILLLLALFTFLHTIIRLPLDTLNPLFIANQWDWQPHRKLGAKFLVMLCAGFTLLLGEDAPAVFLAPLSGVLWSQQASPSEVWLSPTGSINLCFTTEGRLATVLIIPSSWGSQWAVLTRHQAVFWCHCQGERRLLQGESRTHNLYFVIILLYFIFACIILSKIQKN
jgi:hypothetical protein